MASKRARRLPQFVQRHGDRFRGWYSEAGRKRHLPSRDTPEEAHRDAVQMRHQIASMRKRALAGQVVTLGEMLDRLRDEAARDGYRRWWEGQRAILTRLLSPASPLHMIDKPAVEQFIRLQIEDGVTPNSLAHCRRALNRCFVVAMQDGLVDTNPIKMVRWPRYRRNPPSFLRWEEIQRHLARLVEMGCSEIDLDLFRFVALTGLRRSEVARVRVEDIDLGSGLIYTDGKRRNESAAIHPDLKDVIQRRIDDVGSGPIFPRGARWISQRFDSWRVRLDEPRWRSHTLGRHSLATNAIMRGVDVSTVKRMLRHASITTTERYVHLAAEDAKRGLSTMRLSHPAPPSRLAADEVQTGD